MRSASKLSGVLTWYGAPFLIHRHKPLLLGISLVLMLLLWLGALPLLNLAAFPWIFGDDPRFWLQMGLAWGVALAVGLGFLHLHRRYAHRCPRCHSHIPGPFGLGKHCPQCDELLNPWLIAGY